MYHLCAADLDVGGLVRFVTVRDGPSVSVPSVSVRSGVGVLRPSPRPRQPAGGRASLPLIRASSRQRMRTLRSSHTAAGLCKHVVTRIRMRLSEIMVMQSKYLYTHRILQYVYIYDLSTAVGVNEEKSCTNV